MANRKGSMSLAPRPTTGNKGPSPTGIAPVSAAYAEALQVISDDRMRKACRLVLAEPPPLTTPTVAYDKLLEYYKECQKAVATITKEAPSEVFMPPPAIPLPANPTRTSTGGIGRMHAKPVKTGTAAALHHHHHHHRQRFMNRGGGTTAPAVVDRRAAMMQQQHKQNSDGSLGNSCAREGATATAGLSGTTKPPASKKMRLATGPRVTGTVTSAATKDLNPPPEARQFLAKLNKESARTSTPSSVSSKDVTLKKSHNKSEKLFHKQSALFDRKRKALDQDEQEEQQDDDEDHEEEDEDQDDDGSKESLSLKKNDSPPLRARPKRAASESSQQSLPEESSNRRVQPRRSARNS